MSDKVVCDKVACERDLCRKRLCVTKSYLREVGSLAAWMSTSATSDTQSARGAPLDERARHHIQPHATSATPAMLSAGGCCQVPGPPQSAGGPSATSATQATLSAGGCCQGPRLPRKVHVAPRSTNNEPTTRPSPVQQVSRLPR